MIRTVFLALALGVAAVVSHASEEGALRLSLFSVESSGIGDSGPVKLRGAINEASEVVSLVLEAFGRTYVISDEVLRDLPKDYYNGVQLSYDEGYQEIGGRTVLVVLCFGSSSRTYERAVVSVPENGCVAVRTSKG